MELEATILERLQELRRWQVEQQDRLLKQQQEQRDLLSFEQDRMYQALGLSVQSIISDDSLATSSNNLPIEDVNPTNCPEVLISETSSRELSPEPNDPRDAIVCQDVTDTTKIDEKPLQTQLTVPPLQLTSNRSLNFKSSIDGFSPRSEIPTERENSIVGTPENIRESVEDLSMDGVEPLPVDKPTNKFTLLDDLPVPSPKKDFKTLLEERLRDCEANGDDANDPRNPKIQIKRPFLRKGEGLARFKPNTAGNSSNRRSRQRSSSISKNTRKAASNIGTKNNLPKFKETPKSSKICGIYGKNTNCPATAQTKLILKNVPPPRNVKAISALTKNNSISNIIRSKPATIDMNSSSDIETKNRRELEEMRIFELLEEKAENSSFCSNSSTVLALFRQSTPCKTRICKNTQDSNQRTMEKSPKRETSDTSIDEIVRTTRSNMFMPVSPVKKIHNTVIHEDYMISKWETGSHSKENIDTTNSNGSLKRAIEAEHYKTTKHTTIQFNNNNNNNNVNDDKQTIIDSKCSNQSNNCKYNDNNDDLIDKRGANIDTENKESNVSLHVRFSEYNEYKTIGLTDTSTMSNDSNLACNYTNDKAWSDRSTSPDSSDVEILFSNDTRNKEQIKSSLAVKGSNKKLPEKLQCYRNEVSTDQTTDGEDEDYTSICSNEESYDEENITITDIKIETMKSTSHEDINRESSSSSSSSSEHEGNCNDSGSTIGHENDEITMPMFDSKSVNDTIFKSELLKTRLAELEREIDIFRKENAALAIERKKLHDDARQLQKEYKLKEDNLEKERRQNEEILQDERKRLSREKAALENRLRDAREKSLQNKHERQEIQILREQLDELREETSQKECRWQASQARQKSQIRVLQTDNARLKQELEKIRASRTNNLRNRRQQQASSNTRTINQISKQLDVKRSKNIVRKDSTSEEEKITLPIVYGDTEIEIPTNEEMDDRPSVVDLDGSKTIIYNGLAQQTLVKSDDDLRKKRNMYANLLSEATEGLRGNEEIYLGKNDKSSDKLQHEANNESEENFEDKGSDSNDEKKLNDSLRRSSERMRKNCQSPITKSVENNGENTEIRGTNERISNSNDQQDSRCSTDVAICQKDRINQATIKQQDIREVQCPDGHMEYWYPNGNVKKIYPDRNVTKMIYYNGDVRESKGDGSVKYFYASTRTWHTTLPDGLEILEFPDGQVERRTKNGTNEVSFPDGSVRILQVDGTEKWILPDGTVAETFPDGNKILSFPNGQREVHTKEHKRREYPDGTVKLVYPDGTQETRYSTGRVRVKDKDGNLLVDVHHR